MPVQSNIEVVGVKDTLKELRRLDPELRKEFTRQIKSVVAPMVMNARAAYPTLPISGMARAWSQEGATKFPWNAQKARSGVKVKTSTRKNQNAVVYVTQANPAAAIYELATAGNSLGRGIRSRNPRVLWPAYDKQAAQILAGVRQIVTDAERTIGGRMV